MVTYDRFSIHAIGTQGEYNSIDSFVSPNNPTAFIFDVFTTGTTQFILPLISTGVYDFNVDWGDGTNHNITTFDDANLTHNYSTTNATYVITITGTCSKIYFNDAGSKLLMKDITQWGDTGWRTANFFGCANLKVTATDGAGLWNLANFYNMFRGCTSLDYIDVSEWNCPNATDAYSFFYLCGALKQVAGAGKLIQGNITRLINMFHSCSVLQYVDMSGWDTSKVWTMYGFFTYGYELLEANVSEWDTGLLQITHNLFFNCNKVHIYDMKNWNVSLLTDGINMLYGVGMTQADYDPLLVNWSAQTLSSGTSIHFGTDADYSESGARSVLTSAPNNWIIIDGNAV